MRAVHQYVPVAVSVYWLNALNLSGTSKTWRLVQYRQIGWPSIAPVGSVGKATSSFSYALKMTPDLWTFWKWVRMPRCRVARFVNRCAADS